MSALEAVRLVATREIRERMRSRVYRITTLLTAGIVAALIVLPTIRDKETVYDIGLAGQTDPVIRAAVASMGPFIGAQVRVRDVADAAEARAQLRDGRLDIALVRGRQLIVNSPVDRERVTGRSRLVAAISEAARLQTALTDAGLTSEKAAAILQSPALPLETLGKPRPAASQQVTTFVGVIAIFIFFQTYGSWILVGVAEEKSSRIAEVLLAAVRPRHLVGGKILGIGVVGLVQALVVALSAIVAARAVGSDVLKGAEAFGALAAVGWFALGFGFYGWLYAAAGSLVARQSDAQAAGFPISIPLFISYFAAVTGLSGGEPSALVRILAYLPPTAPMCMPTLLDRGGVPAWHVAAVVAGTILTSVLMARIAGAVYSNSILRTGKRIKWTEALRSA
jgi:ABC-2 type transport system permease protein